MTASETAQEEAVTLVLTTDRRAPGSHSAYLAVTRNSARFLLALA